MTNNGNAGSEIVPFGKYKGQPAEVLIADTDYCDWLTAQPWFRERFGNIYNLVINYGTEPQDSPEHNQMQAKFLDDGWCQDLAIVLFKDGLGQKSNAISHRKFEIHGWDVIFQVIVRAEFGTYDYSTTKHKYEWDDIAGVVYVELKPDLGDDYPSVLRQMQRQRADGGIQRICLVVRRYAFEHVTWEQVVQIFAASGIVLVAESEIDPR